MFRYIIDKKPNETVAVQFQMLIRPADFLIHSAPPLYISYDHINSSAFCNFYYGSEEVLFSVPLRFLILEISPIRERMKFMSELPS